jgi:hypothetical protein
MKSDLQYYTEQMRTGVVPRVYQKIIKSMQELRRFLEAQDSNLVTWTLYQGYLDMTYFAITTPHLQSKKLKIAVVYQHENNTISLWLAAANRKLQAHYWHFFRDHPVEGYHLSQLAPGCDAIIERDVIQLDLDHMSQIKQLLFEEAQGLISRIERRMNAST